MGRCPSKSPRAVRANASTKPEAASGVHVISLGSAGSSERQLNTGGPCVRAGNAGDAEKALLVCRAPQLPTPARPLPQVSGQICSQSEPESREGRIVHPMQ